MPKNNVVGKDAALYLRIDSKDLARLLAVAKRNNFDKVTDYLRWHIKKVIQQA